MNRFKFTVEIEMDNDMSGETGQQYAQEELESVLGDTPLRWEVKECTDEELT